MALFRGGDPSDPLRPDQGGPQELRKSAATTRMAFGTLACPLCDAPVAPAGPMAPADALQCPVCDHQGRVRDFLSLATPTRPAYVEVRVVSARRLVVRPRREKP